MLRCGLMSSLSVPTGPRRGALKSAGLSTTCVLLVLMAWRCAGLTAAGGLVFVIDALARGVRRLLPERMRHGGGAASVLSHQFPDPTNEIHVFSTAVHEAGSQTFDMGSRALALDFYFLDYSFVLVVRELRSSNTVRLSRQQQHAHSLAI
eukprot:5344485-Pleurochrysis_carterae.AAC.4